MQIKMIKHQIKQITSRNAQVLSKLSMQKESLDRNKLRRMSMQKEKI